MSWNRIVFIIPLSLSLVFLTHCSKKESAPPSAPEQATLAPSPAGSPAAAAPADSGCTYTADPASIKVEWTAYKFTEKTPVKGTFNKMLVTGSNTGNSLAALAMGLKMDIDGASIESGDPGRNITVKQFFFQEFNPPFKMSAKVTGLEGDDSQGNLMIELDMNGVKKAIPFAYTVKEGNLLEAKSGFDMNDYNLSGPFNSIHDACETLHTGKNGVSKTWPDVDLLLTGKFSKSCP